jgi:hypothetical protein
MKDYIQAIVVFILAIPFIYMAFDIGRDIIKESGRVLKRYGKPLMSGIFHVFSK